VDVLYLQQLEAARRSLDQGSRRWDDRVIGRDVVVFIKNGQLDQAWEDEFVDKCTQRDVPILIRPVHSDDEHFHVQERHERSTTVTRECSTAVDS
jgi:hypothetical protein